MNRRVFYFFPHNSFVRLEAFPMPGQPDGIAHTRDITPSNIRAKYPGMGDFFWNEEYGSVGVEIVGSTSELMEFSLTHHDEIFISFHPDTPTVIDAYDDIPKSLHYEIVSTLERSHLRKLQNNGGDIRATMTKNKNMLLATRNLRFGISWKHTLRSNVQDSIKKYLDPNSAFNIAVQLLKDNDYYQEGTEEDKEAVRKIIAEYGPGELVDRPAFVNRIYDNRLAWHGSCTTEYYQEPTPIEVDALPADAINSKDIQVGDLISCIWRGKPVRLIRIMGNMLNDSAFQTEIVSGLRHFENPESEMLACVSAEYELALYRNTSIYFRLEQRWLS